MPERGKKRQDASLFEVRYGIIPIQKITKGEKQW